MMKKILAIAFVILSYAGFSQEEFKTLKDYLHAHYPQLNIENKIIVVNVWESSNTQSRELNKEFQRVASIYESAKLKGGSQGTLFVSICADKNQASFQIIAGKDNITTTALICDEKGFNAGLLQQLQYTSLLNKVYASNGALVYSGLHQPEIFTSFNQLLTR